MDDFFSKYIKYGSLLRNKIVNGSDLDRFDKAMLLTLIDYALDKIINEHLLDK